MKKQKTKLKNNQGITLVALVVTIVVLLILAGVSISLVLGENGLISKAKESREKYAKGATNDETTMNNLYDEMAGILGESNGESSGSGEIGEGGTGESSGGSEGTDNEGGNTGGGDSEGGSSGDSTDEGWENLPAIDRVAGLKDANPVTYLFYDGDEQTSGYYTIEKHFNTQGYKKVLKTEATCECGHAREIFEKAKEMELVTIYDQIEDLELTRTNSNGEEDTAHISFITAPIKEPSMVYYNFEVNNIDQKSGKPGAVSIPYALNYETSLNGFGTWLDGGKGNFEKNSGGDYETALTWLGEDYAQLGYTILAGRAAMYPFDSFVDLGQVFTFNIQVLTQTDFMKAAKALNLDLSSYDCIHPNE